jgi:hypothetical protein
VLLARLAGKARAAGVCRFRGTCLASNDAAIRLLRGLGPVAIGTPHVGVVDVRVDLRRVGLLVLVGEDGPGLAGADPRTDPREPR